MALILLVEDDLLNREMICRYLQIQGFDVVTAVDGAQAVVAAQSCAPDLILMDMGLPILSGWQATEQIKASPVTHATPIVALTAYAMAEDRDRAYAVGCDDFETKPVNFLQLKAKIQALLDRNAVSSRPDDRRATPL
jgi:CheY-like chemotaxis protein